MNNNIDFRDFLTGKTSDAIIGLVFSAPLFITFLSFFIFLIKKLKEHKDNEHSATLLIPVIISFAFLAGPVRFIEKDIQTIVKTKFAPLSYTSTNVDYLAGKMIDSTVELFFYGTGFIILFSLFTFAINKFKKYKHTEHAVPIVFFMIFCFIIMFYQKAHIEKEIKTIVKIKLVPLAYNIEIQDNCNE